MSAQPSAANPNAREPTLHEWAWVVRKMSKLDLLVGMTDRDVRVQRWRTEILRRGWGFADSAVGRRADGSVENWAAFFKRMTGESL